MMNSFQRAWRIGFAPELSTPSLLSLARALASDDPRLAQGFTTSPPPMRCVWDWPVKAADPIGFCGLADGLVTVGEVEEFFARACFHCDELMGEPAGCRHFLNCWDDMPRDEARAILLAEVLLTLEGRGEVPPLDVKSAVTQKIRTGDNDVKGASSTADRQQTADGTDGRT